MRQIHPDSSRSLFFSDANQIKKGKSIMKWIDLRSDTVTMPTDEMRQAMASAELGDDVYGEDPTVCRLEALAAETVGKEAALFLPSGTMGNQVAIMSYTARGDEVLLGASSHIVVHEVGAAAVLSGVMLRTFQCENDIPDIEAIEAGIRSQDIHEPPTRLICLENALANGRVVPLARMKEIYAVAQEQGIKVHTDGARLFNAAVALGVTAADIAACSDSVMFCLSKGLCSPVGSMLAGTGEFIARARKNRKMLGGGMRQAGILAAAGLISLTTMTLRLHEDHENARYLAAGLQTLEGISLDPTAAQINMVFFHVNRPKAFVDGLPAKMRELGIKINGPESGTQLRFVANRDVTKADIDKVIDVMKTLIQ